MDFSAFRLASNLEVTKKSKSEMSLSPAEKAAPPCDRLVNLLTERSYGTFQLAELPKNQLLLSKATRYRREKRENEVIDRGWIFKDDHKISKS